MPVQKSFLQHAKDSAQTILSDVGLPSTMAEYHEANRMLKGQITHPLETAKQVGEATVGSLISPNDTEALQKARESWAKGDHVAAARHFMNYVVPFVGGSADKAGDAVENKEWGKAVGHTVTALLPFIFGGGEEAPITSVKEAAKATASRYKEAPVVTPDTGTVAGPRTQLNTTTRTTAGVEAPISALQQENAPLAAKVGAKLTTPNAAQEFQRTHTAPAALRQLQSTVGQVAEDKIAAHEAVMNGDPAPERIAGTQTASKLQTHDEAAQATKVAAQKTYQKADDASNSDVAAWQGQVKNDLDEHKALIDRHNANIDAYNANLAKGEDPMPQATFDPNSVALPEKPMSYSELKSDLDRAKAESRSGDAAVREDAFKTNIPKAEKALDNWFKQHSDTIPPAEYDSAKKLYADSERFQDIANAVRGPINKGTLTGNTLRGLEAKMDNQMIRRGQTPGSFQRLLGSDGYENWQNVAKLFDPAQGVPKGLASWGAWAGEYLAAHFLGPWGLAGKAASEFLMNRVMFSPEWGNFFSRATNMLKQLWTREHGELGLPGTVGEPFEPELSDGMRSEFHQMMDRAQGKATAEVKAQAPSVLEQAAQEPRTAVNRQGETVEHNVHQGEHTVRTSDTDGNRIGTLVAHDTRPGEVTISTNQIDDPANRGQGRGGDQIKHLLDSVSPETKILKSDISTTEDARGAWEKLSASYPDAVSKKVYKDGQTQYSVDMEKYRSHPSQDVTPETYRHALDVNPMAATLTDKTSEHEAMPEAKPVVQQGEDEKAALRDKEIATRRPTAVGADTTNNPETTATLDALTGKTKETVAQAIAGYKDNGLKLSPDQLANPAQYADSIIEKAVDHFKNNLVDMYNRIPESIRGISKQWYDSAHQMSKQMANQYGIKHEQAAAVIAALSPNNPWDNNVGMAQRLMERWKNDKGRIWDDQMDQKLSTIRNAKSTKPEFRGLLDSVRGHNYADLTASTNAALRVKQGLWLRMADQAYGDPQIPVYAPDGTIRGSQKIAWGPYDAVAKAVDILENGSIQNINDLLGQGHKIRNFYNNIISPNSTRGHVTIDTHAVGAAHWKPFSQKDVEVAHNFGGSVPGTPGAGKNAASGIQGTYPVYAEAYKQAAKEVGVSPREMQSITWGGIRSLMSREGKTPELRKAVAQIWQDHEAGKITADQARDQIVEAAGGFKRPVWTTDAQWNGQK
jgi:hypothetical protein